MKLIIFGASGVTGRLMTGQALEAGHDVTAFVRNPAKLPIHHAKLKVFQGDVRDADSVSKALAGHDAVLSAVGTYNNDEAGIYETSARNLITGMAAAGVQRLSYMTSYGAPDGFVRDPQYDQWVRQGALKILYTDIRKAEAVIMASNTDWGLVRPPGLIDEPPTGKYRIADEPLLDMSQISRADLAEFMLKSVQDPQYIHRGVFVGY